MEANFSLQGGYSKICSSFAEKVFASISTECGSLFSFGPETLGERFYSFG